METTTKLRVTSRREVAHNVIELTFEAAAGGELPAWTAGAHIDLVLAPDLVRQYSLCGDTESGDWTIAVLKEVDSRGGSRHICDKVEVGDVVEARGPRNHFELRASPRFVFIAGGIGITPMLPMIREAERRGAQWELHYGGRDRSSMAYMAELVTTYRDRVHIYPQEEVGLLDVVAIVGTSRASTLVYCCGPTPLLDVVAATMAAGSANALVVEHFSPVAITPPPGGDRAFDVVFKRSGVTATVPADKSIVTVALANGIDIMTSCSEGTCGTCETMVLEGDVDHRDSILTADERENGATMFVCVSRARSPRLVLDL